MNQLMAIAAEIATACGTFAAAEVKFVPDYQLGEHEFASKIYVVPTEVRREIDSRSDDETTYVFEIGLLRWIAGDGEIQTNAETLESLAESLLGKELTSSWIAKVKMKLLYSVEAVAKRKQYIGVLEIEVRDLT